MRLPIVSPKRSTVRSVLGRRPPGVNPTAGRSGDNGLITPLHDDFRQPPPELAPRELSVCRVFYTALAAYGRSDVAEHIRESDKSPRPTEGELE